MSHKRLLIIGLDGLDPTLVTRWLDQLPTLRRLCESGLHGTLRSCLPPSLIPAWSCAASGRDPGTLGLYGPRLRRDWDYEELGHANNLEMRHPRLWEHVARAGDPFVLVGVPQTFPIIRPPRGVVVTGPLTPNLACPHTHPPELADELLEACGPYAFDVEDAAILDPEDALDQVRCMTARRFAAARHLLQSRLWRLFWLVDTGCWRAFEAAGMYCDERHVAYEPHSSFGEAVLDFYRFVDGQLAELLETVARPPANVWVVSVSGVRPARGTLWLNEWLRQSGYLTLRETPPAAVPFELTDVDWSQTRAWAEGGECGRIFINRAGREPAGVVPDEQFGPLCAELCERLAALTDADGRPLGVQARQAGAVYAGSRGILPDLLVHVGDVDAHVAGGVGGLAAWTADCEPPTGGVIRSLDGFHVLSGPDCPIGQRDASLYDLVPTAIDLMKLHSSHSGSGRSLCGE
jgi:predicted AlkP superfamily phosphohydrolase/phosphomutase